MVRVGKVANAFGGFAAGSYVYGPDPSSGGGGTGPVEGANLFSTAQSQFDGADLSGYTILPNGSGATASLDSTWSLSGTQSLRLTAGSGATNDSGIGIVVPGTITPGKSYRISVKCRRAMGGQRPSVMAKFRSATKTLSEYSGGGASYNVGDVNTVSFVVTAPAEATTLLVMFRFIASPAAGDYQQFDNMSVTEVTLPAIMSRVTFQKPLSGIFPAASEWKKDVSAAPLNSNSANMVTNLVGQVTPNYGGIAAFNTTQFNSTTYVVPGDHPRINVGFCDLQAKGYTPPELYSENNYKAFRDVPVPFGAVASDGSDGHITIYCPDTDQLWEFWQFQESRNAAGIPGVLPSKAQAGNYAWESGSVHTSPDDWNGFSAVWGGRIDNVSQNLRCTFPGATGTTATGIAMPGGNIGIAEAQAGVIDHALALTLINPKTGYSYPAQRYDGSSTDANAIPEGMRLRLKASYNVDGSSLHPLAKMVAKAAQKYGFIVVDRGGAVEVETESARAYIKAGQVDPWSALLNGTPNFQVMQGFPWDQCEVLPFDYGKP